MRILMLNGFFKMNFLVLCTISLLLTVAKGSEEDCPWASATENSSGGERISTSTQRVPSTIKTNCLCAKNPSLNFQLSIQCFEVEASQLVSLLVAHRIKEPLELLYLNASKVTDSNGQVPARIFRDIKMVSLQISGCEIESLHPDAFRGQESQLKHLSLTQNLLTEVPKATLERLRNLGLLDLSFNKITKIPQGTFEKLTKLQTLKLNDNNVELNRNALKGLENSLRNLNLKGTRLSVIPDAISNLSTLAFLDLAQNRLRELNPLPFVRLHSLTALNLERNLLQTLPATVFTGVNDTLSSLSLLNNLITNFPKEALHSLKELRVLDLGFNLLTEIPTDAFKGLHSLTLLALDGNPLTTLPSITFQRLNNTLRGISLGSRFLTCDCRIKWITDWIRDYDLQVTSRERNPQFCGNPTELRDFNFYQIKTEDLKCEQTNETLVSSSTSKSTTTEYNLNLSKSDLALLGLDSNIFGKTDSKESEEGNGEIGNEDEYLSSSEKNVSAEKSTERTTRVRSPHLKLQKPTANSVEKTLEEDDGDDDSEIKPSTFRPSVRPTILGTTTTTIATKRLQPHKPFLNLRPKIQPKVVTSTSTSSSSSTSVSSVGTPAGDNVKNHTSANKTTNTHGGLIIRPRPTSSVASITPVQLPRNKPTSIHTATIEELAELDESNIPVITGIGPQRPNTPNIGSVIPVRPLQTTTSTQATPPPIPRTVSTSTISTTSSTSSSYSSYNQPQHIPVRPSNLIFADKPDIILKHLERSGDSVHVQWEAQKQTVLRVIYRFFGEDTFRHGPPLASTERDFLIHNIPYDECIVVCVVPYEEIVYNEISTSASSIPPGSQCREIRPNSPSALMNHMDKITIGASAAICCTVLVAVLIFIGITKRAKNRRPQPSILAKVPLGSFPSPSPGPTTLVTNSTAQQSLSMKEWDQMSGLSVRSIPRAQIYHQHSNGEVVPVIGNGPSRPILPLSNSNNNYQHQRTLPDGHSTHRSYLSAHHALHNHSNQSYTKQNAYPTKHQNHPPTMNNYLNNQSRLLRASLGSIRSSQDALNNKHTTSSHHNRQYEPNQRRRKRGSTQKRPSQSDSVNTLSGYESPDNNWTDHDMDVYVTRPTRRNLVPL